MNVPDETQAYAEIVGEYPNQKLNLHLPRGDRGEKGEKGDKGDTGLTGLSTTLTIADTVTGPETPGATGAQGIQGVKGDPGGFVAGTDLNTTDLNLILAPGIYTQNNSSGADSPLSNNYPFHGAYGVLTVWQTSGNDVIQEFASQSYAGSFDARGSYRRNRSNGVWSPWRYHTTQRVDQTAGRVIYQWDDLNNREQMIYGDTGMRNIAIDQEWLDALYTTGATINGSNVARVRRLGNVVELMWSLDKSVSGNITMTGGFPLGFRPAMPFAIIGSNSGLGLIRAYHPQGTSAMIYQSPAVQIANSMTAVYTTIDPWPTVLPGAAIGSIPSI